MTGIGLLLFDRLDEADELLTRLVRGHLLLDAGVENMCKGPEQGVDVGHERSAVRLEEMEDCAEDRAVLKKIVAEREGADEDGQDLVQREGTGVLDDHAVDSTNCVVLRAQPCRWTGSRDAVKERLGLGQIWDVLGREVL